MADEIYTMKRGDTEPVLVLTLTENGGEIDLAGADSVQLILAIEGGDAVFPETDIFGTPVNGQIAILWEDGDTDVAGLYNGEAEITWSAGHVQTVPNGQDADAVYWQFRIRPDLGDTP